MTTWNYTINGITISWVEGASTYAPKPAVVLSLV